MWYKNVVAVPGEVIYEMVTLADDAGFGIAAADIDVSKRHYHERTEEVYVLLSGVLRVTLQWTTDDVSRDVYLNHPGASMQIPHGALHHAESISPNPARVLVISMPAWTPEDHHLA